MGADAAIPNANVIKAQGSHILAIAVGNGISSPAAIRRLVDISGPDIYEGTGDFDITTDDIYRVRDFDQLEDALREAAFQLCAPSVTVEKLVDETPDPGSLDDARPAPGWTINGDVTFAPGGYDWVLPVTESPGSGSKNDVTDSAGFATFQWTPNQVGSSRFTATETIQAGYSNVQSATTCTYRTPDTPDQELVIEVFDGSFNAVIPEESIVTCKFINLADPAPDISITKTTEGRDVPPGDTGPAIRFDEDIEWDYQVTNTGNTTLNNVQLTDTQTAPGIARFKLGTGGRPVPLPGTYLVPPRFAMRATKAKGPPRRRPS